MKTVFMSGAGGMGNIGAEAILLTIIHLFQQRCPEVRFILAAWRPQRVKQLLAGIQGDFTVIPQTVPFDTPRKLRESDVFVVCGDVALTESVIRILPAYWAFKSLWARLFGAEVVFVGVEVEPIRLWLNRLAIRSVLNRVCRHYVLRNEDSVRHLQRLSVAPSALHLGCEPVLLVEDEHLRAFPAPEVKADGAGLLVGFGIRDHFVEPLRLDWRRLRLSRGDVVPGELSASMQQIVSFLARVADFLVEKHRARILFIPHHFLQQGERVILTDHEVARRVQAAMRHPDQTVLLPDEMHPFAVMNLYRQLDLVVSMRHHANSFAHRFGVPTVGLAISDKVIGFFRQLGLENMLVNPLDTDPGKGTRVVDCAIRDRTRISARLRQTLTESQTLMRAALDAVMGRP